MIPDFEGKETFKGRSWHTTEWPADRPRLLVQLINDIILINLDDHSTEL